MKRTTSPRKRRSRVFVVETLESRRLLSAAPGGHTELMRGTQHIDAFVQSQAGNGDAKFNQTQSEVQRADSGGRVDNSNTDRHDHNQDRLFRSREQHAGQHNSASAVAEGAVLSGRQLTTEPSASPATAAVTGSVADLVFAAAIPSTVSFDVGKENEQTRVPGFVTEANSETFGGVVRLDQMPKLIDTLPAVVEAFSRKLSADEAEEGEADEAEEFDVLPPDDLSKLDDAEDSEDEEAVEESVTPPSTERTNEASTDVVFASSEDVENFGGVVEMPEPLVRADDASLVIPFDSMTPAAPRIDQIISQAPMLEVDDGSEETEEPEPISINIQASGRAAFLFVPALAIQAARRRQWPIRPRAETPRRKGEHDDE